MRRVAALGCVLVLMLGLVLSPASDVVVRRLAAEGATGSASIRDLNYDISVQRLRGLEAYPSVLAGTPTNVTNLYVMGSSEFGTDVDSNGRRFFPQRVSDFDLFVSGRGFEQSLFHAIELAAVAKQIPNKKVVFMLSPQWFTPSGTQSGQFELVYSASMWKGMLGNSQLSSATRQQIVARAGALHPGLCSALDGCTGNAGQSALAVANSAFAEIDSNVSALKEIYQAVSVDQTYKAPYAVQPGSMRADRINWDAVRDQQTVIAKTKVHNPLGFDDGYYRSHEAQIQKLKGTQTNLRLSPSVEYDDLQLFLDVARETGIQVMLLMAPFNGPWVDWVGLPVAERQMYYDTIRTIAARNNVQLTDLSSHEYDSYYFWDAIHVGWRGWADVSEACVRFGRS